MGFNPQEEPPRIMMVEPGSLAEQAGLRAYDVVVSLNGLSLAEHGSALGALMRGSEPLVFVVQRGDESLTLTIGSPQAPRSDREPVVREYEQVVPEYEQEALEYEQVALELAHVLEARYLFPDRGVQYAEALRTNVTAGRYASSAEPMAFARQVTTELNALAEDRHLVVRAPGAPAPGRQVIRQGPDGGSPSEGERPGGRQMVRRVPGGPGAVMPEAVTESGWLNDEVAFMRIGLMPQSEELKAWAAAFMEEHAAAEALILDLRMCRGGTIDMMNGFLPYLYEEETHLLTMDTRPGAAPGVEERFDELPELRRAETDEDVLRWHHTIVPSATANKPDMPVYVLTGFTGSACEHLTMALKATGRATVVGRRTGGAGHYSTLVTLHGGYSLMLPIGRTYDPRTGVGWELLGIEPDVAVDPSVAEARALELFEEAKRRRGDS
jgi:C-terminal processing protease CtpA/Prc